MKNSYKIILTNLLLFLNFTVGLAQFSLTTTFTDGNGASGNMFDITTKNSKIIIDSFACNIEPFDAPLKEVFIYYKEGSHVGFESNSSAWTFLGSDIVASLGQNVPTPVNVGPLSLDENTTYGFFIVDNSSNIDYTNGSLVVEDDNLIITSGNGRGINTIDPFAGEIFTPRIWNGIVFYRLGFSIPTLNVWGLIILSISLFILGLVYMRKPFIRFN